MTEDSVLSDSVSGTIGAYFGLKPALNRFAKSF